MQTVLLISAVVAFVGASSCASGPWVPPPAVSEDAVPTEPPTPPVSVEGEAVQAHGMVVVPAASRIQAAQAMAAAVARAELSKFIRIRVETTMVEHRNGSTKVEQLTREITANALPGGGPARFAWTFKADKMTMVARIRVPLRRLEAAIARSADAELARRLTDSLRNQ